MAREIKFDIVLHHVIDGDYSHLIATYGELFYGDIKHAVDRYNSKGYVVIGKRQFTGLKDKNNKDIYEDDILKYNQHYFNIDITEEKIKVVKWEFDRWNILSSNAGESNIEVIGNIHENPELINV